MHMADNCVSVNVCWARTLLLIKKKRGPRTEPRCYVSKSGLGEWTIRGAWEGPANKERGKFGECDVLHRN